MLRYYKVFNIAQCRDVPVDVIPVLIKEEVEPLEECEAIIKAMPAL